ncbi:MAG: hypothetical protein GY849_02065 [Deltaproteobacteria bacterium]|nr:hypothetical protein [Deltaproteobacteria bacterium]
MSKEEINEISEKLWIELKKEHWHNLNNYEKNTYNICYKYKLIVYDTFIIPSKWSFDLNYGLDIKQGRKAKPKY